MQRVYRLLKEVREQGESLGSGLLTGPGAERRRPGVTPRHTPAPSYGHIGATFGTSSQESRSVVGEGHHSRRSPAVLDRYGVGFRVMHGFASATSVHDVAEDDDGRELSRSISVTRPCGLFMSVQICLRDSRYDGNHVDICRIALIREQLADLPSFRPPTSAPILGSIGSEIAMAGVVGNSMRWTPTISATVFRRPSSS